jgi:large subunit ribosomal protein L3
VYWAENETFWSIVTRLPCNNTQIGVNMSLGLVGRKVGMTRLFTDDGISIPVTVLQVGNNRVTQIKTTEVDGYTAVQLGFGERRASRVAAAQAGHFANKVDVTGTTIGKGYAGTIKRHHFKSGRASHGNSRSHNVPGSIGMAQDPGRVFPGKRMTGHLGDVQRTTQNLVVVRVDDERGLVLVKGAVPGSPNGDIIVRPAVKSPAKA